MNDDLAQIKEVKIYTTKGKFGKETKEEEIMKVIDKFFQNEKSKFAISYSLKKVKLHILKPDQKMTPLGLSFSEFFEMRIFSENKEFYIWKNDDNYSYRTIDENEQNEQGDNVYQYEETHYILGNKIENDFLVDKGRRLRIGLQNDGFDIKLPLKYKVRNYFNFNDEGLIRFCDARLVTIINKGDE